MTAAAKPLGARTPEIGKKSGKAQIVLIQGDLTALEVDAFVFYAREDLQIGSGYGTAIQMRAGVVVKKELEKFGKIKMGEAVITGAGEMKPRHIIHACGPKFQEADVEGKLRQCMQSALKVAQDNGIKTLAFPPMGTGFYGVALDTSAKVMFETIKAFAADPGPVEKIIICAVDLRDYLPFKKQMESL